MFGPAAFATHAVERVEVVDDADRIEAELYERDAEHGAGSSPSAATMHGHALAASDGLDNDVCRAHDALQLGDGIIGAVGSREQILERHTVRANR